MTTDENHNSYAVSVCARCWHLAGAHSTDEDPHELGRCLIAGCACAEYSDAAKTIANAADEIKGLRGDLIKTLADSKTLCDAHERLITLRPHHEWHEDDGSVLWWRVPIEEPPYCGSALDEDFPGEYVTHWSPLPSVRS